MTGNAKNDLSWHLTVVVALSFSSCQRLLGWVIAVLGGEVAISETTSPLSGLTSNAPTTQTQLIALLTGVLGSSSKSVRCEIIVVT